MKNAINTPQHQETRFLKETWFLAAALLGLIMPAFSDIPAQVAAIRILWPAVWQKGN